MINVSYDVCPPRKLVYFAGRDETVAHFEGRIPKPHFGGVNRLFQAELAQY